ncbi:hypothetical protein PFISCL1PPCAC_20246, partial [Pristionchus fissidentatus]
GKMVKKKSNSSQNGNHQQNGHANGSAASTANGTSSGGQRQNGVSNGYSTSNGVSSNGYSTSKKNSQRATVNAETSSSRSTASETNERKEKNEKRQRKDHSCQVDLKVEEDLVEKFARLREWRKMETLGELVALLTPVQRQLMDAMLRGSTGPTKQVMDTYERRMNNPKSIETVTMREPLEKQRELFMPALSLLTPCNRSTAMAMMKQLRTFMTAIPPLVMGKNEEAVESEAEQILTMVVTALHHPAFSIDSQMELVKMRDYLKSVLHELIPYTQGQSNCGPTTTIKAMRCLDYNEDRDEAVLEISWTDGATTFGCRTATQLYDFQMKLLEIYGMEKINDVRIIPYFPSGHNFLEMREYVEKLSNMPARLLLDDNFAEEFADTRKTSSEKASSPVAHSFTMREKRKERTDDMAFIDDRTLGILPMVQVPSLPPPATAPSCPYCADDHVFSSCPHIAVKGVFINGVSPSHASSSRMGPVWDQMRCSCCPP